MVTRTAFTGTEYGLVEWADLVRELLPEHYTEITIAADMEKGFDYRKISLEER